MDILERSLQFDVWVTHRLFASCQELTPEQLHIKFDIGHETVQQTLVHLVLVMELWTDLLYAHPVRPQPASRDEISIPDLQVRFDTAATEFGTIARKLGSKNLLDEIMVDPFFEPPAEMTKGTVIADVFWHNNLHRSEVVHMLTRLGVKAGGDFAGWEWETERRERRFGLQGIR